MGRLVERGAGEFVPAAADPAGDVRLAGLIARRRQPEMRAHVPGSPEAVWPVDRGPEDERRDRADPGHAHQAPADLLTARQLQNLLREPGELRQHRSQDRQEGRNDRGRRLVQVGFMRRFDPGYSAMQAALTTGDLGAPLLMHCVHRNASVPPSFDSGMLISNSAVHEIDIARWLLNDEFASATVFQRTPRGATDLIDPQFIVLETKSGVLVDIEVFVNAAYGYDVRAELVCEAGTLTLAPQPPVRIRFLGQEASHFASDWRAHFAAAYRNQLQA